MYKENINTVSRETVSVAVVNRVLDTMLTSAGQFTTKLTTAEQHTTMLTSCVRQTIMLTTAG